MTPTLIGFGSFVGLLAGVALLAIGGMRCAAEAEERAEEVEIARSREVPAGMTAERWDVAARVLRDAASGCDCWKCLSCVEYAETLLGVRALPEARRPA